MAFDIDMIKQVYASIVERVDAAREITGKPLTLSEKILYSHLWDGNPEKAFIRGKDYVDFRSRSNRLSRCYSSNGIITVYASW